MTIITSSPHTYGYSRVYHADSPVGPSDSKTKLQVSIGNDVVNKNQNPNYKVDIVERHDAGTYYKRIIHRVRPAIISGRSRRDRYLYLGNQYNLLSTLRTVTESGVGSLLTGTTDAVLMDQALGRLKFKLSAGNQRFKALIPLVELRETRGLIRGLADQATKLVFELLHLKSSRRRARDLPKIAADMWLTFSFGISPTVNDIRLLSQSINDFITRMDHRMRETGGAFKTWTKGYQSNVDTGPAGFVVQNSRYADYSLSYKYTCAMNFNIQSATNYGVAQQFGLEFGEVIPTFWELVPFSWIVDYFSTVGQFLGDVFESPSGQTTYLSLARKYILNIRDVYGFKPTSDWTDDYLRPGQGWVSYLEYERSKLSSLPHRSFRFKTFDETGTNAVNRLLNLASLLVPRGGFSATFHVDDIETSIRRTRLRI